MMTIAGGDRGDRHADPCRAGDRRPARHISQRQRHAGDGARADRRVGPVRAAAVSRRLPDHAGLRPAARARAPPRRRRAHDPGRGRDRGRRDRARRLVRRRARRDIDVRPGDGPQGRDDRPRGDARAAARRHRRPARRAVDRHADQDRAVRPADGAVRPPRRGAAAGRRRLDARRLLRRGARGRADRDPVPHAGDPAVGPVPRQQLRAVADPVGRRPAGDRSALRGRRATPTRRSFPTRATSTARVRGRCPARRAISIRSAASRRPT